MPTSAGTVAGMRLAVLVSGTGTILDAMADAGLPVVTSTQAMIWWGMRTIGVTDDVLGFGSLYGVDPAESRN